MRSKLLMRALPTMTAALTVVFLASSGQPGLAGTTGHAGGPLRARITGQVLFGTPGRSAAPVTTPSKKDQIKKLTAALKRMHKDYVQLGQINPGPNDVF